MSTMIQRSFPGGEIAPALQARVDTVKYATGLKTLRNSIIMRHGGTASRAGTTFVAEVTHLTDAIRLLPFVFNNDQTYVVEIGELYIRFVTDGGRLLEASKAITGITKANPAVVTTSGNHLFVLGDEIYINGVLGMSQVNNRQFTVSPLSATTFQLLDLDGLGVDSTGYTTYSSAGTAARVYTVGTATYAGTTSDLARIQYVQSADVMTLVHRDHAPAELARLGNINWTLSDIAFEPDIDRPNGGAVSGTTGGAIDHRWSVTAVTDSGEESLPGREAEHNISAATQANPVVVTSASHGFTNDDEIYIDNVAGMVEINGGTYLINVLTGNTFELVGIDGTGFTAYTSGGKVSRTRITAAGVADPTPSAPIRLTWTAVTGASQYNVYRARGGSMGFIGVSQSAVFDDIGTTADIAVTPPRVRNLFTQIGDYPSAVTYSQQRLMFANTDNNPETVWASRTGQFHNFTVSIPIQDDDAMTFSMAGRQVHAVRHLLDLQSLQVFSAGGEIMVKGDQAGILRPGEVNPERRSYNGASGLSPIVIDDTAIYVQDRGSVVRDYGAADQPTKGELSNFAAHLFEGHTIVDWAYQKTPHSIVWAVRDDGILVALTYVREQEILGWHRHDTDGFVENVCVVPEDREDAVYIVVRRTIDGDERKYIERLASRIVDDIADYIGMDCTTTYDGRNTGATTMTLSGSGWDYTDTLTLTASVSFFKATDVGNAIHLTGADGTIIRCAITAYTSGTVVSVQPNRLVPVAMRSTAITDWARAVDQVSGLWHLEGKSVSVLADGHVIASPNNSDYDAVTVANGSITLDRPYGVIHVGLPFIADLQTLDIDIVNGETLINKNKIVTEVSAHVENTRGVWAGAMPPEEDPQNENDNPLYGLTELKVRDTESYDEPTELQTGVINIKIQGHWNSNGRVFIRQVDPLPCSILSVAPTVMTTK